jgi:hypothetical protein
MKNPGGDAGGRSFRRKRKIVVKEGQTRATKEKRRGQKEDQECG